VKLYTIVLMSTCFNMNQNNKSFQNWEIPWILLSLLVFLDKLQCSTFKDLLQYLADQRTEFLSDCHHMLVKVHITLLFYISELHITLSLIILC